MFVCLFSWEPEEASMQPNSSSPWQLPNQHRHCQMLEIMLEIGARITITNRMSKTVLVDPSTCEKKRLLTCLAKDKRTTVCFPPLFTSASWGKRIKTSPLPQKNQNKPKALARVTQRFSNKSLARRYQFTELEILATKIFESQETSTTKKVGKSRDLVVQQTSAALAQGRAVKEVLLF